MEWLEKHWGILAASAVGILMIYFLYQTYQSNQANAASQADPTLQSQESADEAAYAQQIALGNVDTGIGSGGGVGSVSSSAPVTSTVASTTSASSPTVSSTPATTVSSGSNVYGDSSDPYLITSGPNAGQYNFPSGGPPGATQVPNPNAQPQSSVASTLLGNPSTPVPVSPISTPLSSGAPVATDADGEIPQHNTLMPTPSHVDLSTISGGRR